MKKHIISIFCGILVCAMLFASCTKNEEQQNTTNGSEPYYSENTSQEALSSEVGTTAGSTAPKTTRPVSTTRRRPPSTTLKKQGSKTPAKKEENKKPPTPPATSPGSSDDDRYRKLPVEFNSLAELKKIAKANKNTAGCDLFKEGKIITPDFDESNVYGEVNSESIDFYSGFYLTDNPDKDYDILYSVNLKKSASKNMADYVGQEFIDNSYQADYKGTTYYIAVVQDEDDTRNVVVTSFCGSYCTMAVFYNPPLDLMGQMDFMDMAQFSSAAI